MRTPIAATLLTLALGSTLAAQQPAPPVENPITTSFRGRILASHRNIAQAFDSIPASLFSYKPTPAQQTIGYIAQHLVNDNGLQISGEGPPRYLAWGARRLPPLPAAFVCYAPTMCSAPAVTS